MLEGNKGGYSPFSHDSIEKMTEQRKKQKEDELRIKEEEEQFRVSMNRLFASEDGKLFLNKLKRVCALNSFDKEINPAKLIEDAGRRKVWFELVRPYLDKSILMQLEQ